MYGRVHDANEVTANYRKFCDEIRPLLEDSGVCIGFHPDDPPTYKSFGGIARINGTFDQIQRNIDIGNSPNLGITSAWASGWKVAPKWAWTPSPQ